MHFPFLFALGSTVVALLLIGTVSLVVLATFLFSLFALLLLRGASLGERNREEAKAALKYLDERDFWKEESRQNIANQALPPDEEKRAG